jgi:hypothetical protein
MSAHPHPSSFYVAHILYSGRAFPKGPVWGALTDGPEELAEVIDRLNGWERDDAPTIATLKVWRFQDDVPPRDVTEDVLAAWADSHDVEWIE